MVFCSACCLYNPLNLGVVCKLQEGFQPRHWAVSLELTVTVLDLFQALLLEQTNDSITTPGKNLEMWIVSYDHHPLKTLGKTC